MTDISSPKQLHPFLHEPEESETFVSATVERSPRQASWKMVQLNTPGRFVFDGHHHYCTFEAARNRDQRIAARLPEHLRHRMLTDYMSAASTARALSELDRRHDEVRHFEQLIGEPTHLPCWLELFAVDVGGLVSINVEKVVKNFSERLSPITDATILGGVSARYNAKTKAWSVGVDCLAFELHKRDEESLSSKFHIDLAACRVRDIGTGHTDYGRDYAAKRTRALGCFETTQSINGRSVNLPTSALIDLIAWRIDKSPEEFCVAHNTASAYYLHARMLQAIDFVPDEAREVLVDSDF